MKKILALALVITMLFAMRNINGKDELLSIDTMINDIYEINEDITQYFTDLFSLLDFDLSLKKIKWDDDENALENIVNMLNGLLEIVTSTIEFLKEFLFSPFKFLLPTLIKLIGVPLRWAGFIA